MSTIDDDELILFHYRDGLTPARIGQIEAALASSPALARRLEALKRLLAAVDHDVPPAPDAQFEQRTWERVQARLDAAQPAASAVWVPRAVVPRTGSRRPRRRGLALAAGMGLAALVLLVIGLPLGLPLGLGPQQAAPAPTVVVDAAAVSARPADQPWQAAADRILTAQLAQHLRSTQGVLQSVAHSDSAALMPMDDTYMRTLATDNRLYAAAADRRGSRALAGFLRSLDPVLIELANRSGSAGIQGDESMRELVRDSDLLFQVRAVQARLLAQDDPRA